MIKTYYYLTKPRLAMMNVMVAMAVYVFASPEVFDWGTFFIMSSGLAFVVASACVFNNVADRTLDTRMERTKHRATATGEVSPLQGIGYAAVLLVLGVSLLMQTHILALAAALLGFFVYVFLYTPLKPKSRYALYVGAVAGATPTLVGYAAAAHTLDYYAYACFAILFLWQIPHFLAIARYRFAEYAAGGVPLWVAQEPTPDGKKQAKKIFRYSLVFLLLFCLILILHRWIR